MRKPIEQRFWAKVQRGGITDCWNWIAYKNKNGYGMISTEFGKAPRKAHVLSYELARGKVPEGMELDHLCRNRACVNPDHLEAVTHKVNTLRGNAPTSINARKTHCKRGHPLSGKNLYLDPGQHRGCRICRSKLMKDWWKKNAPGQRRKTA